MRVKCIDNKDVLSLTVGKEYDVLKVGKCSEDDDIYYTIVCDDGYKYDILSVRFKNVYEENMGVSKSQEQIKKEIKPRKEFELERISHLVKTLSTLLENDCDDYELLSELSEEIYDRIFDLMYEE